MKTTEILSEKSEYLNGKRVATVTTQVTTSLGDEMAQLANYQSTLASHQLQIERLVDKMPVAEEEQKPFQAEIKRLIAEMNTLRQAIVLQEGYIKGFGKSAN